MGKIYYLLGDGDDVNEIAAIAGVGFV